MPINASIPLQGVPVQVPNVMQSMKEAMGLHGYQQEQERQNQDSESRRRAVEVAETRLKSEEQNRLRDDARVVFNSSAMGFADWLDKGAESPESYQIMYGPINNAVTLGKTAGYVPPDYQLPEPTKYTPELGAGMKQISGAIRKAFGPKPAAPDMTPQAGINPATNKPGFFRVGPNGETLWMDNVQPIESGASFQKDEVMVPDGKGGFTAVLANYNPKDGKYYDQTKNWLKDAIPKTSGAANPQSAVELGAMLVSGMIAPSQLSKFGGAFNEAMAQANRVSMEKTGKPYNAQKAAREYAAALRFASSINSTQMQRFTALAESVVNTIDEVDTLAQQLDLGGVQFANKVELEAALKLFSNSEKGQLIAKYIGATTALKEEFANLIQGGYAPTEAAFELANQQVNQYYGAKAMRASLQEVKRLINFRMTAFDNLTVRGVEGGNPIMEGLGGGTTPPPPPKTGAGTSISTNKATDSAAPKEGDQKEVPEYPGTLWEYKKNQQGNLAWIRVK